MSLDAARRIADAVLYEGYLLWPYRRSALKNQRRWTFGGVYPGAHHARHPDDPCVMRTQCLLEASDEAAATIAVTVRFLQVQRRRVARAGAGGRLEDVDELTVGGERHLAWDEAVEREVAAGPRRLDDLRRGRRLPIAVAAGAERETLHEADGRPAGALVRERERLDGVLAVDAEPLGGGLHRVTATITNTTPWDGGPREEALRRTFCSTHTVLETDGGRFVSLTDPPAQHAEAAARCRNDGTWPVLLGEPGEHRIVLSSPIILEDHPRVAPESPGDLFDGAEIDQLLRLSILALTDAEKAEMRATDPRARAILEQTEALTPGELARLHGTLRP